MTSKSINYWEPHCFKQDEQVKAAHRASNTYLWHLSKTDATLQPYGGASILGFMKLLKKQIANLTALENLFPAKTTMFSAYEVAVNGSSPDLAIVTCKEQQPHLLSSGSLLQDKNIAKKGAYITTMATNSTVESA